MRSSGHRRARFERLERRVPRDTGARMGRDLPWPRGAVRRSLAIEAHRRRNRSLVPALGPRRRVGCAGALVLPAELDSRCGKCREPAASVGGSPLRSFPCKSCDGGSTVRVFISPFSSPPNVAARDAGSQICHAFAEQETISAAVGRSIGLETANAASAAASASI